MKKHMLIGAIALLLVCLSACGAKSDSGSPSVTGSGASFSASSAPGASSSQAPELPAAWTPYLEVLRGEAEFYSVIIGRNLDMAHLKDAITPDDQPLAAVKEFAAVDLDRDGKEEIILRVAFGDNDNAGFVILHETDGYIYGYSVVPRGLQELKADGTFSYSSGAADHGFGALSFTAEGLEWDEISYCSSSSGFFVDHEKTTEKPFREAMDRQDTKEDAAWHEYEGNGFFVFPV